MGPRPAGPMFQALMFFESFKRMRLAHSSRKCLTRVIVISPGISVPCLSLFVFASEGKKGFRGRSPLNAPTFNLP